MRFFCAHCENIFCTTQISNQYVVHKCQGQSIKLPINKKAAKCNDAKCEQCVTTALPQFIDITIEKEPKIFKLHKERLKNYQINREYYFNQMEYYRNEESQKDGDIFDQKNIINAQKNTDFYKIFKVIYDIAVFMMYRNEFEHTIMLLHELVTNEIIITHLSHHIILVDAYCLLIFAYYQVQPFEYISITKKLLKCIINIEFLPDRLQNIYNLLVLDFQYFTQANVTEDPEFKKMEMNLTKYTNDNTLPNV